ncbi:hypothetical protein AVEN_230821-1 [Araneus ventricosus]|uniref:Uncharacterized protein n=1 Tax=Araneus ventricosus TaxID=182803 RepID=A0A4Y2A4K0_ARAVE|nr:hypothetical protein AVEN_230821-1 [Araneus ventricosus]
MVSLKLIRSQIPQLSRRFTFYRFHKYKYRRQVPHFRSKKTSQCTELGGLPNVVIELRKQTCELSLLNLQGNGNIFAHYFLNPKCFVRIVSSDDFPKFCSSAIIRIVNCRSESIRDRTRSIFSLTYKVKDGPGFAVFTVFTEMLDPLEKLYSSVCYFHKQP